MPSDHTVVLSLHFEFLKHGCRHIRSWSGHQQTGADPACRTWHPYPVSIRYPLLRCCWPTHTMSDFSPRSWHCDPMARLGLWAVAGSVICIRNVMQIDRLQVKKYWMKTAWSKLRLARTKRWFLLISQLLSHHVLSWYHADNCQAVKSMVDAPHYVRTVKRAKRSRKFNAGY